MPAPSYTDIGLSLDGHVATIEIQRPPHNFFDFSLIGQIADAFSAMDEDPQCRAIVLAAQGKSFCAGANFGSGRINAYRRAGGGWKLDGRLPVKVEGVWGIAFGTGGMSGPRTTLFYAAGPHEWLGATEENVGGELGSIRPG